MGTSEIGEDKGVNYQRLNRLKHPEPFAGTNDVLCLG